MLCFCAYLNSQLNMCIHEQDLWHHNQFRGQSLSNMHPVSVMWKLKSSSSQMLRMDLSVKLEKYSVQRSNEGGYVDVILRMIFNNYWAFHIRQKLLFKPFFLMAIHFCVKLHMCMSISGQTGLYEVVGEWYSEWLQRRQSQNRTILSAHCKFYCALIIHTRPWCLKLHTDVPHNMVNGPHPVCFPFVSQCEICAVLLLFSEAVSNVQCCLFTLVVQCNVPVWWIE